MFFFSSKNYLNKDFMGRLREILDDYRHGGSTVEEAVSELKAVAVLWGAGIIVVGLFIWYFTMIV